MRRYFISSCQLFVKKWILEGYTGLVHQDIASICLARIRYMEVGITTIGAFGMVAMVLKLLIVMWADSYQNMECNLFQI